MIPHVVHIQIIVNMAELKTCPLGLLDPNDPTYLFHIHTPLQSQMETSLSRPPNFLPHYRPLDDGNSYPSKPAPASLEPIGLFCMYIAGHPTNICGAAKVHAVESSQIVKSKIWSTQTFVHAGIYLYVWCGFGGLPKRGLTCRETQHSFSIEWCLLTLW
jgi:hypothetical protein